LTVLVSREETRGLWSSLKMKQWRLLKALDVSKLSADTLKKLAEVFDKYANRQLKKIPEQFNPSNPDRVRLGIDREFIRVSTHR